MSLEVTGKLLVKYDAQQVSEKFRKREFVLELAEEINGNIYTNFAKMQLVQTKCDIIDRFKEGDVVRVSFNIKGNSYVDKKDGVTKYITNLDAWRVESGNAAPNNNAGGQQAQQPYQAAPAYNNTGANTSSGNSYSGTPNFNPSPETIDDLPF
jgi:single-stranded DNA-binding protein